MTEKTNRALLLGLCRPEEDPAEKGKTLKELEELARNIGLETVRTCVVKLKTMTAALGMGTGKAEELRALACDLDVEVIVFDDGITPTQQRNWEELTGKCVIDRNEVILEIFADRAATREASLQVELARMQYSLPRLARAWTHLSRQRGGNRGSRGGGETQLELDRRKTLDRIVRAKRELKKVGAVRKVQRTRRERSEIPTVSIVGYTNAGKSSLLKALTGNEVLVADKLFATLDPTTRRLALPSGSEILLTDTVGFIRKLPHALVNAFKATLEEAVLADLLVHVTDASNPDAMNQAVVTRGVLEELGALNKPIVSAFNKIDLGRGLSAFHPDERLFPNPVFVSAATGEGIEDLKRKIDDLLGLNTRRVRYVFPADRHDLVALLHRTSRVLTQTYSDDEIEMVARVDERTAGLLASYEAAEAV